MSSDSMQSNSDETESDEEQEAGAYGTLRRTFAAITEQNGPRRTFKPSRSSMRSWSRGGADYTRLSTKAETGGPRETTSPSKSVQLLFRDSRAETFLMLARLLYMHKLICEEEKEKRHQMWEKLKDLQKLASEDYKCKRVPWIQSLSTSLEGMADEEIRERLFSIWQQLDIAVIDLMIYMCAEHAQVFLHALCLKVPERMLRESRRKWQLETKWQAGLLQGLFVPAEVEGWQARGKWGDISEGRAESNSGLDSMAPPDEEEEDDDEEDKRSCFGGCGTPAPEPDQGSSWCDCFRAGYGDRKVESELYFTLRAELMSSMHHRNEAEFDHLHFMQSMLRCPAAVFATPLGYACIQRFWGHGAWAFVSLRGMDALYLFALCIFIVPVTHKSHSEDATWPDKFGILCIAMLTLRSALFLLLEFVCAAYMACQFKTRFRSRTRGGSFLSYFRATYLNQFTALCTAVEIWSFHFTYVLVRDCWVRDDRKRWGEDDVDTSSHIRDTVLYRRPMMLCCLMLAKWAQLMLQMLALELLLEPLLPAWHAIKSKSSLTVLGGFILLCVGTANGYYSLPVTGGHKEGFLGALFIMFKLDLMGDFDEAELMAGTQHQEAGRVDEMYFALKGFTILCALVFTVSLLNVYVGILSAKYDEAHRNRLDGMGRFRAVPAFRIHLFAHFVRKLTCACRAGDGDQSEEEADKEGTGFWILLRKNVLPDPESSDSLNWQEWDKK